MELRSGPKQSTEALIRIIETQPLSLYTSTKSKIKLLLIGVGFIAFGALSVWLSLDGADQALLFIGVGFILFGAICGALMLHKFRQNQPTIEVTKDGLYDYQNLKGTFIHWDEIKKITAYKQNYNTFLGLYLFDAESKRPNQHTFTKASHKLGNQLGLPDLIYLQALLGGQKAKTVAETLNTLKAKYNNPFQ